MTLETIYYAGQTLAVFGVLASLVFVGLQVRHSAEQTRQANMIARADMTERVLHSMGDVVSQMISNPDVAGAFRKVMFEHEELLPVEKTQIMTYFNVILNAHRAAYYVWKQGLVDDEAMQGFDYNTCYYLTSGKFAREWQRAAGRGLFSGEFKAYVESRFAELFPDHASPGAALDDRSGGTPGVRPDTLQ